MHFQAPVNFLYGKIESRVMLWIYCIFFCLQTSISLYVRATPVQTPLSYDYVHLVREPRKKCGRAAYTSTLFFRIIFHIFYLYTSLSSPIPNL